MTVADAGDEPVLMAEKLGDIAVVKGGDRYEAGMFALENLSPVPDMFIMDDGFQHRRLHRDLDILLVNSKDPFDNGKLLPVGLMREPLKGMRRADVIVLTKNTGEESGELVDYIRKYNPRSPIFVAGHRPCCVNGMDGRRLDLKSISGKDVYAFCGIAEPGFFRYLLEKLGANITGFSAFNDHYGFTSGDMHRIVSAARQSGAKWITTTEKDIMRLKGLPQRNIPDNLFSLGIEFEADREFFDMALGPDTGGVDAQVH
jgi:tetraacyldisaccharide 4'-kinase